MAAHTDAAAGSSFKRLYILVFDLLLCQYHRRKHVLPMAEINSAALEKKALDLEKEQQTLRPSLRISTFQARPAGPPPGRRGRKPRLGAVLAQLGFKTAPG